MQSIGLAAGIMTARTALLYSSPVKRLFRLDILGAEFVGHEG